MTKTLLSQNNSHWPTGRNTLLALWTTKKFKNGPVLYLGLKLTINVIKSQNSSCETVPLRNMSDKLTCSVRNPFYDSGCGDLMFYLLRRQSHRTWWSKVQEECTYRKSCVFWRFVFWALWINILSSFGSPSSSQWSWDDTNFSPSSSCSEGNSKS